MKKHLLIGLGMASVMFACVGCAENSPSSTPQLPADQEQGQEQASAPVSGYNPVVGEEDSDSGWNAETATKIQLSDSGSEIDGEGAASLEDGVKISKGGEYIISGKLSDSRIVVDVEPGDTLKLVLNGADITCSYSAPIYVSNGDAVIVLEENTENVLTDGNTYSYANSTDREPNACLYGDDNISITGTGKLTVNANFNNGIGSKDELKISSATITVNAVNNALKGNDCVIIQDAALHLTSQGDGIKSDEEKVENRGVISIVNSSLNIISEDDGLQAVTSVSVEGGKVTIEANGKEVNCDGTVNIAEGLLQ